MRIDFVLLAIAINTILLAPFSAYAVTYTDCDGEPGVQPEDICRDEYEAFVFDRCIDPLITDPVEPMSEAAAEAACKAVYTTAVSQQTNVTSDEITVGGQDYLVDFFTCGVDTNPPPGAPIQDYYETHANFGCRLETDFGGDIETDFDGVTAIIDSIPERNNTTFNIEYDDDRVINSETNNDYNTTNNDYTNNSSVTYNIEQYTGDGTGGPLEVTITGGETCASPPVCSGDPLGCRQVEMQWREQCPDDSLFAESSILSAAGLDGIGSDASVLSIGTFDIGNIDIDGFLGLSDQCPTLPSFQVYGTTLDWNILPMCDIAKILGVFMLISGFWHSSKILVEGT